MSDPTIFSDQNQTPTQATANSGDGNTTPVTNDQLGNLLASIVNERGEQKYKTVEEALKGLSHAQSHIGTLQNELTTLKESNTKLTGEVNRINELEKSLQTLTQRQSEGTTTKAPEFTEEKLASVVENVLENTRRQATRKENTNSVVGRLRTEFGDQAEAKFYEKAQEIGLDRAQINELAASSPSAVFKLFGMNDKAPATTHSPTGSTVNTSGMAPIQNSYIGVNTKSTLIGASSSEVIEESRNSLRMVEELHAQGKSISDLTNPKVYFNTFKKS